MFHARWQKKQQQSINELTSRFGCKDSWFKFIFETAVKWSVTKAFHIGAPCNLKLLFGGGFVVGEAYDPFNSDPGGGGGGVFFLFLHFLTLLCSFRLSAQTLEMGESFLLTRTGKMLTLFLVTQWEDMT